MSNIEETKDVIKLIATLAKAFNDANEDGKVNAGDIGTLIQVLPAIGPALNGINEIDDELKDLDGAELVELEDAVKDVIGIVADDKYVDVAAHALKAGIEIFEIVKLIRG